MCKRYLAIVCIIFPLLLCGQANKWINYNQPYYKIKVAKDGIYRVDSATLAKAGIPVNTIDARKYQLFFHGQQQYIYVNGDSVLSQVKGGYIEFYGVHNSGALLKDEMSDSLLYTAVSPQPNPYITAVPNPYYSMFNDTSTYYLTWDNSTTGNYRMVYQHTDTSLFSSTTPIPFFTAEAVLYGSNKGVYEAGARYLAGTGDEVNDPRYTSATGWFMNQIGMGGSITYNLSGVSNVYPSGNAQIKICFLGESNYINVSSPDHHIQISGSWAAGNLTDTSFGGTVPSSFAMCIKNCSMAANLLTNNTTLTVSSLNPGNGVPSNITDVSYIYCKYPHTTNMGNASSYTMYVNNIGGTNIYYNLTNFKNNGLSDTVRFYDLTNHNRYMVTQRGVNYKFVFPNSGNITGYLTADAQVNKVTKVIPAGSNGNGMFTKWGNYRKPYIIISHPALMSEASQYAAYRGNEYPGQVILANVEELYDQFGYGIEKDPLAIRNFCAYVLYHSSTDSAAGLFLIGKGIHSYMYRQDSLYYKATLLPSFGYPSSDALLTAGLNAAPGTFNLEPAIPTGRLSASTPNDVSNYLNKVKIYESNAPASWMKNIVHFAGGGNTYEQALIMSYLRTDSATAVDTSFGARIYTFQKTTSSPIQITLSDSVTNLINNGVSLMTFYGHASGNNFDINLDVPSDYNNVGKYPLILALACFSGDIFQYEGNGVSNTSEQFVLDAKGSIGFLAMDDVAELNTLGNYSTYFYNDFCKRLYLKPIGTCLQNEIAQLQSPYGIGNFNDFMAMEMTLHGDPSIVLNGNAKLPDYAVTDSSLSFSPANITQQLDSFQVSINIINNAKAVNQAVPIELDRTFVNGKDTAYRLTVNNIYNHAVVTKTLPVDKIKGIGLNKFSVKIDPSNLLTNPPEITRVNNNLNNVPLNINSGDIIPIYPFNYAIIPKDTATLKASTNDPFASAHNYIFEIDTTIYFNSPFFRMQYVNAKGGVVRAPWQKWINSPGGPPKFPGSLGAPSSLLFKDSTVYYWRTRRDTSDIKDYGWQNSSFQYIRGKSGWGQSHYFQFDNNEYTFMQQVQKKRNWIFDSTGKTLQCTTYGNPYDSSLYEYLTGAYLDYNLISYAGCGITPGLYMVVIDSTQLVEWTTTHNLSESNNATSGCSYPTNNFQYRYNDAAALNSLPKVLKDSIPNGDYILIYSWVESYLKSMQNAANVKNELIALGASPVISSAPDTVPLIFFVKKGSPSTARTLIGSNKLSVLSLTTALKNNATYGSMSTPMIGPAQKWDSISWRQHSLVKNAQDSVRLNVTAIDNNGNSSSLLHGVTPAAANIFISSLNAKKYPYLQMSLYTKDAVTHTPSQMNKWQVFYTPVPEVAVNPSIYSYFHADTLTGGDTIRLKTVLQNVGDYTMDSMIVNAWIVDPNNAVHNILPSRYTKKLNPGDTTMLSVKCSSNGYNGANSIWIEANPPLLSQTRMEEYYFNNYVKRSFIAQPDKNNPLLDVTFDGVHILNNDIVSPHPNILMEVTSDNKFLALNGNDTGNIAVYIRNVNNPVATRIYFGPQMQFTPAVLPNNRCKILYTPTFADGTYELSVQVADRSNNVSATNPYKIDFQVINESSITNVLNYPNPFSTATHFVFTLTGDQVPSTFKIQIMTITGKVIREITESELGPIHIGRNITEYAWDGTDQFGSKLANGVYLYRVITSINNQAIDHLATNADSFFIKGWGKMYLLR